MLFQLGLGLGQSVDFVLLCLQVIQGLLMGLLEGFLLLGQLSDTLILRGHLLSQVLHLIEAEHNLLRTMDSIPPLSKIVTTFLSFLCICETLLYDRVGHLFTTTKTVCM